MPQLDAYIPAGALSPDAERDLIAQADGSADPP